EPERRRRDRQRHEIHGQIRKHMTEPLRSWRKTSTTTSPSLRIWLARRLEMQHQSTTDTLMKYNLETPQLVCGVFLFKWPIILRIIVDESFQI
ncbi:MAG TPA: hypothetical protein PLR22_07740, partial [Saprospiraceae bacterium]|nr:hypothetical protein [Saprospiraceae bacterium]